MYAPPLVPLLLALYAPAANAAEIFDGQAFYLGDLHAHTGFSGDAGSADLGDCDGSCGNLSEVFDTARANNLDFLAITDHLNSNPALSDEEWRTLLAMMIEANDPGSGFVTIPAGELWFVLSGTGAYFGHKTLLLFGDDATLAPATLSDVRFSPGSILGSCEDIWSFMEGLEAGFGPAMIVPHHPAVRAPMYTDWACHDPYWQPAVEIYSEHGNSLADDGYDTPGAGVLPQYTAHNALHPEGYALTFGFVGGTDSHDTRPGAVCSLDTERPSHLYAGGLTVVALDAGETFDRSAIHDAIRDRRTYVTTGPALPMRLTWSAGGYTLGGLGQAIVAPLSLELEAQVVLPGDRAMHVTAVELVGPDATWALQQEEDGAWTGSVGAGEVPPWLYVSVEIDGASWYGVEGGCPDGGDAAEYLWGSPSPIALVEDDADGDGASAWVDDCDDLDATIHPGAVEVWYDGVDQDCGGEDDYDQDSDGVRALGWGEDCDDLRADVHPGAVDDWYDGVDADCAGDSDFDQDLDGWDGGAEGLPDCDDTDPTRHPDAVDTWYDGVDQDCDGRSDFDQDGDGVTSAAFGGADCDDLDPTRFGGATEVWYDGVDQDCDPDTEYDRDGDGVPFPTDCHDTDATRWTCDETSVTHRGCITGGGAPTAWLALVAALLAARRRVNRA